MGFFNEWGGGGGSSANWVLMCFVSGGYYRWKVCWFFFFFFVGQSVGGRYGRWTGVSSLYGFICLFGAFLIFFLGLRGGLATGIFCFFFLTVFWYIFMGLSTEGVLGGVLFYFLGCIFFFSN